MEFWNGCILFNVGLVNAKLKDSVNLGFLFLTFGSHVIYPIINVPIPSPTRFEIRQLSEQSPNHVLIYLLISKSTSSSISASVSWHWKKPTNSEYTHIENLHQWCSCHRSVISGMADALEECWPVIMLITGK